MVMGAMSSILVHLAAMSKAQRRAVKADVIVRISSSRMTRKERMPEREAASSRRRCPQKLSVSLVSALVAW